MQNRAAVMHGTHDVRLEDVLVPDDEVRAGGEARGVGGQVEDGGGYLVRLGEASERRHGGRGRSPAPGSGRHR
jgi:hypothetical protein